MAEEHMNPVMRLLRKVRNLGTPTSVPAALAKQADKLSDEDKKLLRNFGVVTSELTEMMYKNTLVNYDRYTLSQEIERSLSHPLMSAAVELYADVATAYNTQIGASVWVTAESRKYENELNNMLDFIGIEEKVFDWAWTVAAFGDLFVKIEGQQGVGITTVDDSQHPLNMSRLDVSGRLVGFFETPYGMQAQERKLHAPWDYVHARILGAKKKRPIMGDPLYTEFAAVNVVGKDKRRVSTKYGTSVLLNALPVYKRLRLAEDSIMLARLSKGITRYLYKVKIDGGNMEAVSELIDEYKTILKKARAVDLDPNAPYFDEKYEPMGVNEDLIVPVWGDVNDLAVEKLGGEADIKWIKDVDELRNQLSSALRVPLQLLGGYPGEMPSGLGRSAIDRYDIRFARSARRVQRAIIDAVTRMCQIHLAYQGLSPSTDMFQVQMSETSTAEEEELKESLESGVNIVNQMVEMTVSILGDRVDRVKLMDYLNRKILKLDDFDLNDLMLTEEQAQDQKDQKELPESIKKEVDQIVEEKTAEVRDRVSVPNTDLKAFLPIKEQVDKWTKNYGKMKVEYKPKRGKKK